MKIPLLLTLATLASLAGVPAPSVAQSMQISIGRTSSGVQWLLASRPASDGLSPSSIGSNADRHALAASVDVRDDLRPWIAVGSGLRLVPKGFEVTGPTIHMLYVEVPFVALLQSGPQGALFLEVGGVLGLRVKCRRFMATTSGLHEDGCNTVTTSRGAELEGLRHWDASWSAGMGGRLPLGDGRLVGAVRLQRSLFDIQPNATGSKMVNRVGLWTIGYEWDLGSR